MNCASEWISDILGEEMIKYVDSIKDITPEMPGGFFEGWVKPHSNETH